MMSIEWLKFVNSAVKCQKVVTFWGVRAYL
nr:MAG TPA: hypothetical protein [Caudoviricetes sp.]